MSYSELLDTTPRPCLARHGLQGAWQRGLLPQYLPFHETASRDIPMPLTASVWRSIAISTRPLVQFISRGVYIRFVTSTTFTLLLMPVKILTGNRKASAHDQSVIGWCQKPRSSLQLKAARTYKDVRTITITQGYLGRVGQRGDSLPSA